MASIDTQASALMDLASDALTRASDMANRIVRTDPNFSSSLSHTITDPLGVAPADTASLVGAIGSFTFTPTLPTVSAPGDPQALLGSGLRFDHAVQASSLAMPGDPQALLGMDLRFDHTVTAPVITKPLALEGIAEGEANETLVAWLDDSAELWFNRFFPELSAASANKDKPEQWLWGVISGSEPFGVAPEVFTAVWNQARDREYRARNSAVDQIRMEFSARGFGMPPGAMIGAVARAEETAADAIAGVNIAQAIRDSEIKLDLLKFAEEQALRLKSGVMQSLADFYRQWISIPEKNYDKGRLQVEAYDSLNRALNDYYQIEMRFEEMRMKAAELRATGGIEESKLRVSTYSTMNDALSAFRSGEISLEDLRVRAENLRASGALDESKLKVSTYSALQNAMGDYYRIMREYEALKGDMSRLGIDSGVEGARLKVAAYSAMHSAMSAYNQGKINIEELKLTAKKAIAEVDANNDRNNAVVMAQTYSSWNNGYASAANAFADIGGQAVAAAGTINAQITSV